MAAVTQPSVAAASGQKHESFLQIFVRRFLRNKPAMVAAIVLLLFFTAAALAPVLAPRDPSFLITADRLKPPGFVNAAGFKYLLGSDNTGRDILARLLYGARISMTIGFVTAGISLSIGVVVGAIAGYYGGWLDNLLMRIVDFMLTIPQLPLILIVLAIFKNSFFLLLVVLGVTSWMSVARLVRGEFLSLRERDFVEAARSQGALDSRIIYRHILPNAMAPLIVNATFRVAGAILTEATLSFLGLGVQPPTASWGNMLIGAADELGYAWWTSVIPGIAITFAVLSFNLVGDGLRDALDPRMKQ